MVLNVKTSRRIRRIDNLEHCVLGLLRDVIPPWLVRIDSKSEMNNAIAREIIMQFAIKRFGMTYPRRQLRVTLVERVRVLAIIPLCCEQREMPGR